MRDVPILITLITDDGAGSEMLRQEVLQEMERVESQIGLQISISIAEVDRFGESYIVSSCNVHVSTLKFSFFLHRWLSINYHSYTISFWRWKLDDHYHLA